MSRNFNKFTQHAVLIMQKCAKKYTSFDIFNFRNSAQELWFYANFQMTQTGLYVVCYHDVRQAFLALSQRSKL